VQGQYEGFCAFYRLTIHSDGENDENSFDPGAGSDHLRCGLLDDVTAAVGRAAAVRVYVDLPGGLRTGGAVSQAAIEQISSIEDAERRRKERERATATAAARSTPVAGSLLDSPAG
jgi:hypothetical protein